MVILHRSRTTRKMAAKTAAVVLAAGAGALIGYTVFTGPSEEEKKGGSNLKTRLSENAIACAEVAATPFGDKGHPQFGREMSVANEEHHDKHKQ